MATQAGSAYITVRPDMTGFHAAIQRDVSRIGQQVGAALADGIRRGLGRSDPFEPFRDEQEDQRRRAPRDGQEQAGAFARGFERQLRAAIRNLPRIEIDADSSEADRTLADLRSRMDSLADKTVGVDISADDALRELEEIQQELERVGAEGADINVRADVQAALARIRQIQREVERLDGDDVSIDVDVDVDHASGGLSRLTGVAGAAMSGLRGLGTAAGMVRFAPLAVGAAAAAGAMVQVVSAVGPLLGLTAVLPATFIAAKVAAGTLKLALYGVSDAFSAAMTGDATEFEESLKNLSPAARSVATELRTLKPELLGIQQAAQQSFFSRLTGELTRTAGVLAGPLKTGVSGVAAEFGAGARQVAAFARESASVSALGSIFGGVRQSLQALLPAVQPVAAGIRDIAAAGSGSLPSLAVIIGDLATKFGGWLSQISGSGQVQQWISGALAVAQQLMSVLGDVGGIITSIFQSMSAAGSGTLGPLGTLLDQMNAFLNSAEGSTALTSFFSGLSGITSALAPLVPLVGSVVAELVRGLLPVAQALTPVISVLVGAIGMIVRALVPVLAPLGQVIASLVSGLLPILQPIINLFAQTATTIGQALVQALTASLPSLQQIVLAVASLLPALMPLIPLWSQWLTAILPIVPVIAQLAALLIGYLVPPLRFLIALAVGIVSTWMGLLIPVFRLLVGVITWVAGLVQPILAGLGVAFRWLGTAATWLWKNAITPAFRGISAVAQWLYSIVAVVLITPLVLAFRLVAAVARWLWTSVISPVFRGIGAVISWAWTTLIRPALQALNAFFRTVIAPVFRWVYNSVIRPVWNAVGAAIRYVWTTFIRPAFNAIRDGVGKLGGYFRSGVDAIRRAWDGLKSAAKKPVSFVINTVWNGGIVRMWNAVARLVPGTKQLGEIRGFARGGVVGAGSYGVLPGYAPGRDTMLAAVSPGEAWIRPDATRALGSDFVYGLNSAAVSGGTAGAARFLTEQGGPQFGLGGIVGGFLRSAKNMFSGGLVNTAKKAFDPLMALAQRTVGGTPFGDLAMSATRGLVGKILAFFKPLEDKLGGDGRKVVSVAEKYVGMSGNPNKWTRRMGMNGLPWCAMFVDGVFDEANASKALAPVTGGRAAVWSYRALPKVSPAHKRPGDLGLYRGDTGHINIFTGKGAVTIGGNESNSVRRQSGYINSASSIRRPRFALGGIVPQLLRQDLAENDRRSTPLATQLLRGIAGAPTLYDDGGWLPPGVSTVANFTGKPEAVLTGQQLAVLTSRRGDRNVSVMENATVIVQDPVDVDMLAQRQEFAARAATFGE